MMVQQAPSLSTTLLGSLVLGSAWGEEEEGENVRHTEEEAAKGTKRRGNRKCHLVLNDGVVGQTQEGVGVVSELEGALVELRNRLVHVQDGVLLVHFTDHLVAQTHV